jgi:hypothetical protein
MAVWWVLSIGVMRRSGMWVMLRWWGLVVLRVVTILSMHWRRRGDRCRSVHRRWMLVVHGRQGRRRVLRDVALRRIRPARRVLCLVTVLLLMCLRVCLLVVRRVGREG